MKGSYSWPAKEKAVSGMVSKLRALLVVFLVGFFLITPPGSKDLTETAGAAFGVFLAYVVGSLIIDKLEQKKNPAQSKAV